MVFWNTVCRIEVLVEIDLCATVVTRESIAFKHNLISGSSGIIHSI